MNQNEIISQLVDQWKVSESWHHRTALACIKTDKLADPHA
jgi:hypothetical protein